MGQPHLVFVQLTYSFGFPLVQLLLVILLYS